MAENNVQFNDKLEEQETDQNESKSGFMWLDEEYDSAEGDTGDMFGEIPKPQSAEEVLREIEEGRFAVGILLNTSGTDDYESEKVYTNVQASFRRQGEFFQVEFRGSDADLNAIWQQLEIYGDAANKAADGSSLALCSILFIPSKYVSTVIFEVDGPVFWALSASKIGSPANCIRLVAPTELIGVYETDFDAKEEVQDIAIEKANEEAREEEERRRQSVEAYREIYAPQG